MAETRRWFNAAFTNVLCRGQMAFSMDGRGRAFDNIFSTQLWRLLKYKEVYLHDYQTPAEARLGLGRHFDFYKHQRPHQALDYRTPTEVTACLSCRGEHGPVKSVRWLPLWSGCAFPPRQPVKIQTFNFPLESPSTWGAPHSQYLSIY